MGESGLGYGWTSQRLWEAEGATGGETETERGRWGRRIFYQQNSRTASGWSLETSSSGAWGQLWAPFSSLLAISPLGPAWGRGALLALTPLDTHTHTMNQADNSAWACPPGPAMCVKWDAHIYKDAVCECMCVHMKLSHGRKCENTCTAMWMCVHLWERWTYACPVGERVNAQMSTWAQNVCVYMLRIGVEKRWTGLGNLWLHGFLFPWESWTKWLI